MTVSTVDQPIKRLPPGSATASGQNILYRLGKLKARNLIDGKDWLDCGCAEGGYTSAFLEWGAKKVVGIDIELSRVMEATARHASTDQNLFFCNSTSELTPFPDQTFDGIFINEVLEHVIDDQVTINELFRVLRAGGHLALISPNRWFPFEGHGMKLWGDKKLSKPAPLVHWLPKAIGSRFMYARNYWPSELANIVKKAGFNIVTCEPILPVFEFYPWMPKAFIDRYRTLVPQIERTPIIRQFMGVSTLVLGQRPP